MGKKTVVLYSLYISDDEVCNWMNTETSTRPPLQYCSAPGTYTKLPFT